MSKYNRYLSVFMLAALMVSGVCLLIFGQKESIDTFDLIDKPAQIRPDYNGVVLPANIAAKIYSENGRPIEVFSRTGKIVIPPKAWRRLLESNRGRQLYFDIYVKAENRKSTIETRNWKRYSAITNRIAVEDIDSFLVYRKMHPTHTHIKGPMGIYQRNLRNFQEKLILDNNHFKGGCLNCHTFCQNSPDEMLLGIRSYGGYGISTLFIEDSKVEKIAAKFGYTSWHPSGKLAVYSINYLPMFWHYAGKEVRDTVNLESSLAYFLTETRQLKTIPAISRKEQLENWPVWSPDGRELYFCRAPKLWPDTRTIPPEHYRDVRYDLVRISYDVETDRWGQVECILSAKDTGKSIAMPSISPDGRWLLFCMIDYGYFPSWHRDSDLYLMDLKAAARSGEFNYSRLDINSNETEAWQSFSSNSRWIAFSSKRDYGIFTRTYISYIDDNGKVYKPLLLPQKDPGFYDSYLLTYTVPELVTEPVKLKAERLGQIIRGTTEIKVDVPITMASPEADSQTEWGNPERMRE